MTTDGRLIVFKLGGSLLSLPDLPQRLETILSHTPTQQPLIVVGGGEAANLVRHWQSAHSLSNEAAHWLALRAMSLNEVLLHNLLPHSVIVSNRTEFHVACDANRLPILSVERFLREEEVTAEQTLPHDWSATSDSIAAWVAQRLGSQHVTLLKSIDLSPQMLLSEAVDAGIVDAHFPILVRELAVSWVNVRSNSPYVIPWTWDIEASRQSPVAAQPHDLL